MVRLLNHITMTVTTTTGMHAFVGDGVIGFSYHLLRNNTAPDYAFGESFFTVFGVFFPTACGVLAGINMSGDLRNPRKAIAQGTIAATFLRFVLKKL